MEYNIDATQDSNFKITVNKFGEQFLASDGDRVVIAPSPEEAVEELQEHINPPVNNAGPKPVPLNGQSTMGVHWFEGTPWSTSNNNPF